jgi:hypothetical protein
VGLFIARSLDFEPKSSPGYQTKPYRTNPNQSTQNGTSRAGHIISSFYNLQWALAIE